MIFIGQGCLCDKGYFGGGCLDADCVDNCNQNGDCIGGQCYCRNGYKGSACEV